MLKEEIIHQDEEEEDEETEEDEDLEGMKKIWTRKRKG